MVKHPTWTYEETIKQIDSITDTRIVEFAQIAYLTGGRIMEVLSMNSNDVKMDGHIIRCSLLTLKTRRGNYVYRELANDTKSEPFYANALYRFSQFQNTQLKDYIQAGGKRNIEYKMQRELGIVPHSLRHLRATHMGKNKIPGALHQNTAPYLKYYFGWASLEVASRYIENYTIIDALEDYKKKTAEGKNKQ